MTERTMPGMILALILILAVEFFLYPENETDTHMNIFHAMIERERQELAKMRC